MDPFRRGTAMIKYKKDFVIGSGTFSTVYLVKHNGIPYALKEINMNYLTPAEKQRTFNEVRLLAKLSHRYIIKYIDSSLDHMTGTLVIVTEYAHCGDLSKAIANQRGIPFGERKIISWFIQISLALQYIHSQNILHRDLKTQNIFLCKDNTIKVGDFGIARVLGNSQDFAITGVGTPYYFSPEICMRKPYNLKSDMWALGCILFEISALTQPFKAENLPQLMGVILEGKRNPFPSWSTDLIKQLVEDLLNLDPDKRPSTGEILAYPSLQPYLSVYIQRPKKFSPCTTRNYRSPEESYKRSAPSASTLNSNCSKLLKFSPRTAENESKLRSASTKAIPPAIVVTEYKTPEKLDDGEWKPSFASTRIPPRVIAVSKPPAENQLLEKERKKRCITIRGSPPAIVVTDYKAESKLQENERKPRSASTKATPPAISVTGDKAGKKLFQRDRKPRSASTRATPPTIVVTDYKAEDKVHNSKPVFGNRGEINVTFTISKEANADDKTLPSALTPNDIDCGYSSEEINCSQDSSDSSVCEHSTNNNENEFSVLKGREHKEKSNAQSNCHHPQCHQCMLDMMWKNRIRGCVGVSGNINDYMKLRKKLQLIFQQDLFQKVYESLLNDWEGNENSQSQAAIRSYVKLLNYEQVQHLPLMMQLIQLDFLKLSKDETHSQVNELVML